MRISDWSSNVCSSDLFLTCCWHQAELRYAIFRHWKSKWQPWPAVPHPAGLPKRQNGWPNNVRWRAIDRKSVVKGKRVSVRVDLGGRRIINKTHIITTTIEQTLHRLTIH